MRQRCPGARIRSSRCARADNRGRIASRARYLRILQRGAQADCRRQWFMIPDARRRRAHSALPLDDAHQTVVPRALKRRVLHLNNFPASAGHLGSQRMRETKPLGFYLPGMIGEVYHTVRCCETCAKDRVELRKRTKVFENFPARAPLESVELDLLGSLPKSSSGNTDFQIYVASMQCSRRPRRRSRVRSAANRYFCTDHPKRYSPATDLYSQRSSFRKCAASTRRIRRTGTSFFPHLRIRTTEVCTLLPAFRRTN